MACIEPGTSLWRRPFLLQRDNLKVEWAQSTTNLQQDKENLSKRTQNSDAQFYRALKKNNSWNDMKQSYVGNFADGGTVGASARKSSLQYRAGQRSGGDTNATVVQNIMTPDANSFRRSEGQSQGDSAFAARRAYERNG